MTTACWKRIQLTWTVIHMEQMLQACIVPYLLFNAFLVMDLDKKCQDEIYIIISIFKINHVINHSQLLLLFLWHNAPTQDKALDL